MSLLKERFQTFSKYSYYVKAEVNHILDWNIGLDSEGNKAIKLRGVFVPHSVKGTAAVKIEQFAKKEQKAIIFSLVDEEVSEQFYRFCEDMLESSRNVTSDEEGYMFVINSFIRWKKMFLSAKKDVLTEKEIMGLIGEITFLKDVLFAQYGQHQSLQSWSGQELTHKDFSIENTWYEVKGVSKGKSSVQISSIEQLESDKVGEFVVYMMEKMSPQYKGVTLNKLVEGTYKMISNQQDKADFFAKVSMQGFAYNDYYDDYVYEVGDGIRFLVEKDFPRLQRGSLDKAILKAKYELDLKELVKYMRK